MPVIRLLTGQPGQTAIDSRLAFRGAAKFKPLWAGKIAAAGGERPLHGDLRGRSDRRGQRPRVQVGRRLRPRAGHRPHRSDGRDLDGDWQRFPIAASRP